MYESPIDLTLTPMQIRTEEIRSGIDGQIEKEIIAAVRGVHIDVDREELIKALNYNRRQYEKGYADAKVDVLEWLQRYYKKSTRLKGRYFPQEVIAWLINDISRNLLDKEE